MKALLTASVLSFAMSATAATTCIVTESQDGENYDKILTSVEITQDGNPAMVFQRENLAYMAVDNGRVIAIGQIVPDQNGEAKLSIMAASNGTQAMLLNATDNLAIACIRQ